MKIFNRLGCGIGLFLIAVLIMGGCASFSSNLPIAKLSYDADSAPEETIPVDLKERLAQYWGLQFAGLSDKTFEYEAPYFQEMVNKEIYHGYIRRIQRNRLIEVDVKNLQWETPHLIKINLLARFEQPGGEIKEVYYEDMWVNAGNVWFHIPRDQIVFRNVM